LIYSTKGIVLRTIKYGETSIVVSIFTELFGIQTYLVNGVRTPGKSTKAHLFQPSSLLEMQVYHNELKNLQRIKEVKWSILYKNILSDVIKNSIALFMVELLQKTLKQPETNENLFHFCEVAFLHLDIARKEITANFSVYFSIRIAQISGFSLQNNYSEKKNIFSIKEGCFVEENLAAAEFITPQLSRDFSEILKAIHPNDLSEIKMNGKTRSAMLKTMESFYGWHIPEFGKMKTLNVLSAILS
jgi:DNA repair protein RecO (recombination protein O)